MFQTNNSGLVDLFQIRPDNWILSEDLFGITSMKHSSPRKCDQSEPLEFDPVSRISNFYDQLGCSITKTHRIGKQNLIDINNI